MSKFAIPTGWNLTQIGSVLKRVRTAVDVEPAKLYREIGIRSHGKGIFHKAECSGESLGNKSVFWIEPDCFVLNIVFAWEQAVAKTTVNEKGMIASHRFPMYKPVKSKLDLDYIVYFFKTPFGKHLLGLASPGGAGRNKTLGQEEFQKLTIALPPYFEQQKIADILSTWDEAITTTECLIAAFRERKKGLMQRLLTGQVRFTGFEKSKAKQATRYGEIPADWGYVTIGSIAHHISAKNKNGDDFPVLSCTKYDGLVDSLAYFGRQIFSEDTSTYKIVKRGQFAYATNHIEEGSIGYQNLHDRALISPMYTVFETNSKIHDGFLYKLLKTELYRHVFEVNTSGSIDRRGSLRWDEFSQIKIPLPSLEEQKAISEMLDICEQEITLTKKRLVLLQQQKKGLMQRLLTGEIRVRV